MELVKFIEPPEKKASLPTMAFGMHFFVHSILKMSLSYRVCFAPQPTVGWVHRPKTSSARFHNDQRKWHLQKLRLGCRRSWLSAVVLQTCHIPYMCRMCCKLLHISRKHNQEDSTWYDVETELVTCDFSLSPCNLYSWTLSSNLLIILR